MHTNSVFFTPRECYRFKSDGSRFNKSSTHMLPFRKISSYKNWLFADFSGGF